MELREKNLDIDKEFIVEIAGKGGSLPEKKIVREAILAVVHYIKSELKKDVVSASEFSEMLKAVLEGFGYHVNVVVKNQAKEAPKRKPKTAFVNLDEIVDDTGNRYELFFFDSLAKKMKESLRKNPKLLCINGLHECVKKIVGVNKWNDRCRNLSEEIVSFARSQFRTHGNKKQSALLIR